MLGRQALMTWWVLLAMCLSSSPAFAMVANCATLGVDTPAAATVGAAGPAVRAPSHGPVRKAARNSGYAYDETYGYDEPGECSGRTCFPRLGAEGDASHYVYDEADPLVGALGQRWYDAATGRFLSEDPVGLDPFRCKSAAAALAA